MRVVCIDNYDSFSYNIIYLLRDIGVTVHIVQNDCALDSLKKQFFQALIISPGPSHPLQSGVCLEAIRHFAPTKKILGICLGHQCIAHVFGGQVTPLQSPQHGKTSPITFIPHALFQDIPQPLHVARYHSLHVSSLGNCTALAHSDDGVVMALQAKGYQTYGIQFHPESILQQAGKRLLQNFLSLPNI